MSNQNFASHPICIISSFNSIRPSEKIKVNHNRTNFSKILEEMQNNLDQFDTLTNYSMESYNLQTDAKILKIKETARKSLICSYLDRSFIEKFDVQLRKKSAEETLKFIKKKIGQDTNAEKCQKAIEKLNEATRDTVGEEEFTEFLERITELAEQMVDKDESVKKHYIDRAFRSNLTPSIREFLLDQNAETKNIEEISNLLDKRRKYKKSVNIFQLETSDEKIENLTTMISVFAEQKNADSKRIQSLLDQNQKMMEMLENKFSVFDTEICKLKISTKNAQSTSQNFRPKMEPKQEIQNNFPASWELNQDGSPVRCSGCGFQGHNQAVCRGTRATCNICKKLGHIVYACPERSNGARNFNSSKN
jgi:hypothetical protein